jgi:Fe2+ transport system protein FeoA
MSSRKRKRESRGALWDVLVGGYRRQSEPPDAPTNRYQAALDAGARSPAAGGRGSLYRANVALAELRPGECGLVLRLNGTFCGRLRLLEMGLTPGAHVRMLRCAAFGGPVDIEVRGYQLSLRREEAASVWLGEPEEQGEGTESAAAAESR